MQISEFPGDSAGRGYSIVIAVARVATVAQIPWPRNFLLHATGAGPKKKKISSPIAGNLIEISGRALESAFLKQPRVFQCWSSSSHPWRNVA